VRMTFSAQHGFILAMIIAAAFVLTGFLWVMRGTTKK